MSVHIQAEICRANFTIAQRKLARPAGLEPAAPGLEARSSPHLYPTELRARRSAARLFQIITTRWCLHYHHRYTLRRFSRLTRRITGGRRAPASVPDRSLHAADGFMPCWTPSTYVPGRAAMCSKLRKLERFCSPYRGLRAIHC
jgi:hypothetical protein